MDVDVDGRRLDFEKEHDRRVPVEIECLGRSIGGVGEHAIANEASVDEKELIAAAAEAKSARHIAARMCALDQLIDLRQVRLGIGAEDLNDARQRVGGGRQIENQATVVY